MARKRPLNVYDFVPDWTPPEGAAKPEDILSAIDGLRAALIMPWDDEETIKRKQAMITGRRQPDATP